MAPPHSGREVVITFGDLYKQGHAMGLLPDGYAGFAWSKNAWFLTREFSSLFHRGAQAMLLNAHGEDITFESKQTFDLKAISTALLWVNTAPVLVEGWGHGVRKYARTLDLRRATATRSDLDYDDIDRVDIKPGGAHVVIDAITVVFR